MRNDAARYGLATLCLAIGSVALFANPASSEEVGVTAAANPIATGQPPGQSVRELKIGLNILRNERIRTTAEGATQVIFVDRTSLTIGPNSDITIDEYVFNPNTNSGSLTIRVGSGLLRFIGGQISHNDQVRVTTPTATLGIRGGMAIINSTGGKTTTIHLYGATTVKTSSSSVTITRPGYYSEASGNSVSTPRQVPANLFASLNALLTSRPGQTGGAPSGLVTSDRVRNALGNFGQTSFYATNSYSNGPPSNPQYPEQPRVIASTQPQAGPPGPIGGDGGISPRHRHHFGHGHHFGFGHHFGHGHGD